MYINVKNAKYIITKCIQIYSVYILGKNTKIQQCWMLQDWLTLAELKDSAVGCNVAVYFTLMLY